MPAPLTLVNGTLLSLTPLSARGLTEVRELISGPGGGSQGQTAWLRRDVNGYLRDTSDIRFRKYRLTVSCRDGESPCLDDSWIGTEVSVSCASELSYPVGGSPARAVVSGSERTQGNVIYYRPALTMLIAAIRDSSQEYAALYSWDMTLDEF